MHTQRVLIHVFNGCTSAHACCHAGCVCISVCWPTCTTRTLWQENNFNDPSHDTVLHHGASPGMSRANASAMTAELTEMSPVGYTITWVWGCQALGVRWLEGLINGV